ncbi:gas vesicle protein [Bradyrhizobium diazoefficiens]
MSIEFPPSREPSMAGTLDFVRLASEAAATAKTPAEREACRRVEAAARLLRVEASSPEARASVDRVTRAWQEHDATVAARSAEVHEAIGRGIDALAPSAAPITNASFALVRGRMPNWVQEALENIEDQRDDVSAKRRHWMDELQAAIRERGEIVAKIRMNTEEAIAARYSISVLLPAGHPTLVKMQADQAKLDKQIEKLNAKMEESSSCFQALDKLQERCRAYTRQLLNHAVGFVPHDGKQAKKQAVTDLKKAIADVRQEIAELFADLRELNAKPRPSAQVKKKARDLIEATAKPPHVLGAIDHGENILWPTIGIHGNQYVQKELAGSDLVIPSEAYSIGGTTDALGVLCFAFKDTLITAIEAEVDRYADDANAITDEERARGEAELRAKIILAEREEEHLIRLAEERELPFHRRGDADPRVVLGLAASMPALAEDVI